MYFRSPEVRVPEALRIEFVLCEQERVLRGGAFLVTETPGHSVFGETRPVAVTDVPRLEAELFAGLVIEHEIGVHAARLYLHLYDLDGPGRQQVPLGEGSLEVQFEHAEEWQSTRLGDRFDFRYKLTPVGAGRGA
jgi:hypothetical protein